MSIDHPERAEIWTREFVPAGITGITIARQYSCISFLLTKKKIDICTFAVDASRERGSNY